MSDYYDRPGLSYSGMKDMMVSPLRYWYLHVNPELPKIEPTPEMQFGSALHCAVLEPNNFLDRYACAFNPADHDGILETIDDLRGWLRAHDIQPKGTRKAEVIAQVQAADPTWPILDVLERQHAARNEGKTVLSVEDWQRVYRTAECLREEPRVASLLQSGEAEVEYFRADPDTGVDLKSKMDWVRPDCTVDLKTFQIKRARSIDKAVTDAIYYEGYYRQAVFYSIMRGWPDTFDGKFVLAFVESEEPHEVRLRSILPRCGGNATLLWSRALIEIRECIRTYAECMDRFGVDKPWRYAQEVNEVMDEEISALAY